MSKIVIFFILFGFPFTIMAQLDNCYYLSTQYAYTQYKEKKYQESIKYYECAFATATDTLPHHLKLAGQAYSYTKNLDVAIFYLNKAVDKGIALEKIEISDALKVQAEWQNFIKVYDAKRAKYLRQLDHDKIQWIANMEAIDQFVRTTPFPFSEKKAWIEYADSTHIYDLMKMVRREGFPSYQEMGKASIWQIHTIILHGIRRHSLARIYFFDLLLEEMKKGNISPHEYANIIDLYEVKTAKKPAVYGNYLSSKYPTGIQDIARLDERRMKLGLLPFYIYAKQRGWELPNYYQKGNFFDFMTINCPCNIP